VSELRSILLRVAVGAAVAEFVLLRVFVRLGPVLPGGEALLPVYRLAEGGGLLALNLAVLSAVGLLGVTLAGLDWRRASHVLVGVALAAGILANLGLGVLVSVAPTALGGLLLAGSMLASVAAMAMVAWRTDSPGCFTGWNPAAPAEPVEAGAAVGPARPSTGSGRAGANSPRYGRMALGLVLGAEALAAWYGLSHGATGMGWWLPGGELAPFLAEAAAVSAALALPWSFRAAPRRWEIGAGLALGLLFLGGHTARGWILSSMAMWTVTYSLFLPGVVYAAALGIGTAGLLALRRQPGGGSIAAGLLLVWLAGLKPDFSYFALLALAGLASACLATAERQVTWEQTADRPARPEPVEGPPTARPGERRGDSVTRRYDAEGRGGEAARDSGSRPVAAGGNAGSAPAHTATLATR
jgi:hypothetical protein